MENRKFLRKALLSVGLIILLFYAGVYFYMHYAWKDHFTQWIYFHDNEIKGSVVEADTGSPVEGAIVVGLWALTQKGGGEGFGGYANILETETDKNGAFVIPAWKTFKPWKFDCLMHELAPKIVIYKPGFKVYGPHEISLNSYWKHQLRIVDQNKMVNEDSNMNPAKLERTYSDKEILDSVSEFESQSDFPDNHYSKQQLRSILSAIEKGALQLAEKNSESRQRIVRDMSEYRRYWAEGKR